MARRQITDQSEDEVLETEFKDVSEQVDEQERVDNDINMEIGASTGEIRYKIRVYRVEPNGKDLAYLFELVGESMEGLSDRLRDEYGSGKYLARIYKDEGKGFTLRKARGFKIEAPKTKAAIVAPVPNSSGDALVTAVSQQGEMMRQLVAQLSAIVQRPVTPSAALDLNGVAAIIAAMGALMQKQSAPQTVADPMALVKSVVELVGDLQGEGREKGMFDLVDSFLKSDLLTQVVQAQQQPQMIAHQPAPPRIAQPPGAQSQNGQPKTPQRPAQPPQSSAPADPALAQIQQAIALLLRGAQKNSDPASYADVIADAMDPDMLGAILSLPDPVATLTQYNPAVANYGVWFGELIEVLRTPVDDGDALDIEPGSAQRSSPTGSPVASGDAPAPFHIDEPS